MYSHCLSHLKSAWHVERQVAPYFTRQEAVSESAEQWGKSLAFTPCDKNTGKCLVVCQCLDAKRNLALNDAQKQFEIGAELDTHAEAKHTALHMRHKRAKAAGIDQFWKPRKGKGTPVTFSLPKNKMLEDNGEFKARILFHTTTIPSATAAALLAAV